MRRTPISVCLLAALSLLITGCNSSSSTAGSGSTSTTPAITLTASAAAFPNTTVNQTSTPLTITVANTGTAIVNITSYALSGDTADFTQTATNCSAYLPASGSCTLTLTFHPIAAGNFSLTLTTTDNAATPTQSLTLTGTGVPIPLPTAALSPSSLTFTGTTAASTSAAQTFTLTNSGSVALSVASIALTGTNPTAFAQTNTCGTTVAALSSCTISVTFTPAAASTTYAATLTVTDNTGGVAGSTQTTTLSGTSAAPPATPLAVLSPTSLTFPGTALNTAATAQTVTLSNPGTAPLTGIAISLTGTNASAFSETSTCAATLAAGSSCAISVGFTPATAGPLTATLSVSDNATGSPQTLALTGTGGVSATFRNFYVIPEADNSVTPLYALVNAATKTIDMTMYALQDATFTADLVAACQRGVTVRVILDQNSEKSADTPDFNLLNAQPGCTAVWANKAFQVTHEKSFIVDGTTVAILSLNLQQQYYSTTRDYALVENDANDIAAIQATFNMDFAAGTTAAGVVGASDFSYQPQPGDDLAWSPTTATTDMLAIINNATKTLYIENEEFSAPNIVSAVAAAATRGVAVVFVGENESSSYNSQYTTIKTAGASVFYFSSSTGFYVHGKAVVADQGLSTEAIYMGSINYSTASLTENRELGIYITGNTTISNPIAATIKATIIADETGSGVTKF
jgi:phosphatidylserine/phosphatidylglycerophosphate/cardiolipin synthase-like enzyme